MHLIVTSYEISSRPVYDVRRPVSSVEVRDIYEFRRAVLQAENGAVYAPYKDKWGENILVADFFCRDGEHVEIFAAHRAFSNLLRRAGIVELIEAPSGQQFVSTPDGSFEPYN